MCSLLSVYRPILSTGILSFRSYDHINPHGREVAHLPIVRLYLFCANHVRALLHICVTYNLDAVAISDLIKE